MLFCRRSWRFLSWWIISHTLLLSVSFFVINLIWNGAHLKTTYFRDSSSSLFNGIIIGTVLSIMQWTILNGGFTKIFLWWTLSCITILSIGENLSFGLYNFYMFFGLDKTSSLVEVIAFYGGISGCVGGLIGGIIQCFVVGRLVWIPISTLAWALGWSFGLAIGQISNDFALVNKFPDLNHLVFVTGLTGATLGVISSTITGLAIVRLSKQYNQ